MHRGYFALWRRFEDHPFWKEPRVFSKAEAWIDILWQTQHEEEPKEIIFGMTVLTQHYGECLKSTRTWAKRWDWSEAKVRRFFKLLDKLGQLSAKNEIVTTRIKVINFEQYDPRRRANDAGATQERRTGDAQAATNKKVNTANTANTLESPNGDSSDLPPKISRCPHSKIISLYHQHCPELPRVKEWADPFKGYLRSRWLEKKERQNLSWWESFFKDHIKSSDFLMGRVNGFQANLGWIVRKSNFQKIINGQYVNRGPRTGSKLGDANARACQEAIEEMERENAEE